MRRFQRLSRVVAVTAAGFLLVAVGVALLFLPGPGLLLIVAGLAVLATEYRWADRLRARAAARVRGLADRARMRAWGLHAPRRPRSRADGASATDPSTVATSTDAGGAAPGRTDGAGVGLDDGLDVAEDLGGGDRRARPSAA